jgi:hypothetical protein
MKRIRIVDIGVIRVVYGRKVDKEVEDEDKDKDKDTLDRQ